MSKLAALSSMFGPVSRGGGFVPTYLSVTSTSTSMYEGGDSITFTIHSFAIPNGTVVYYTINQVSGTVVAGAFTSNSLSGSVTINNNTGTFKSTTSAEDGNSTDDIFTISIRENSITGPVKLTSNQIKLVDLTAYNAALATYNNGFGGQSLTYSIAATSTGAGNKTTATFQGTTITANGGGAGLLGAVAAGGTYSGGDGGANGGTGIQGVYWIGQGGRAGGGTAGGGGAPAGNNGGTPAQDMGAWIGTSAGTDTRMSGLLTFITSAGWVLDTSGPARTYTTIGNFSLGVPGKYFAGGGGGYAMTQNLTAGNSSYNKANGGAGGPIGGGGGGAGIATSTSYSGVYTYTTQAGGAGGSGGVFVQYDNGTTGAMITTGTSRTIPAGVKKVKVWAIGGGGAGKSSTSSITSGVYGGQCGGGGGGGGMVWKTWTFSGTAPTKPSL